MKTLWEKFIANHLPTLFVYCFLFVCFDSDLLKFSLGSIYVDRFPMSLVFVFLNVVLLFYMFAFFFPGHGSSRQQTCLEHSCVTIRSSPYLWGHVRSGETPVAIGWLHSTVAAETDLTWPPVCVAGCASRTETQVCNFSLRFHFSRWHFPSSGSNRNEQ